jgi:N,N'-diacetyllegionaminate synthase
MRDGYCQPVTTLVLLGRKSEAARALEIAIRAGLEVRAVVEDEDRASPSARPVSDAARRLGVPIRSLADLRDTVDYVVSYLYRRRVPRRVLDLARTMPLNFHPAPLPDFRGVGGYNVGILEGKETWAATAHVMEEDLDTGDVVAVREFPIAPDATAASLEAETRRELLLLFGSVIADIAAGRALVRQPQGKGRYIRSEDFERARAIAPTDDADTIGRKIRAFWFPPYGGAAVKLAGREYTVIDDQILRPLARQRASDHGTRETPFGPFTIGGSQPVLVVAEVGVNHNGERALGLRQLRAAAETGAQAVKFQSFKADELATKDAPMAEYQTRSNEADQFQMLKRLELADSDLTEYMRDGERLGVVAFSTPFDAASAERLAKLGVKLMKVPSGEITNLELLRAIANTGLPTIMSTGMSDLGEVRRAVETHFAARGGPLALLHCVSSYPAPLDQMNLRAIDTLRAEFALPIGLSDHSIGTAAAIAAVALGAVIVEKHFTVDRALPGPDHRMSTEPAEFTDLVSTIRLLQKGLGSGEKTAVAAELEVRDVARRSLVASRAIRAGTTLTRELLAAKRPGGGIGPDRLDSVIGKRVARDIAADEMLRPEDLAG